MYQQTNERLKIESQWLHIYIPLYNYNLRSIWTVIYIWEISLSKDINHIEQVHVIGHFSRYNWGPPFSAIFLSYMDNKCVFHKGDRDHWHPFCDKWQNHSIDFGSREVASFWIVIKIRTPWLKRWSPWYWLVLQDLVEISPIIQAVYGQNIKVHIQPEFSG